LESEENNYPVRLTQSYQISITQAESNPFNKNNDINLRRSQRSSSDIYEDQCVKLIPIQNTLISLHDVNLLFQF
jgi:hypothetical protein